MLGLGEIGSSVAKTLSSGFGMQVVGCRRRADPRPSDAEAGVSAVYPLEELPRFLGRCDYLVSVLPSTPGTRGLLDGEELAACAPRRPALINVGRGDLVSEAAVLGALDRGWLSHLVSDVFAAEPLPTASPLWQHPKVTVMPISPYISPNLPYISPITPYISPYLPR